MKSLKWIWIAALICSLAMAFVFACTGDDDDDDDDNDTGDDDTGDDDTGDDDSAEDCIDTYLGEVAECFLLEEYKYASLCWLDALDGFMDCLLAAGAITSEGADCVDGCSSTARTCIEACPDGPTGDSCVEDCMADMDDCMADCDVILPAST